MLDKNINASLFGSKIKSFLAIRETHKVIVPKLMHYPFLLLIFLFLLILKAEGNILLKEESRKSMYLTD